MRTILVIDDEPEVSNLIAVSLKHSDHFSVVSAQDGVQGLRKAREEFPAVILLDLMLPRLSGFEVCRLLGGDPITKSIPIIILSAKTDEVDRVRGFELGAVGYVTKPFSPREVVLRVDALAGCDRRVEEARTLISPTIVIDHSRHRVVVNGKVISLTAVEFKLLSYLMETRGRVQTRDQLLNKVWEYEGALITRTVDAHMLRLRKKLGDAADAIETVHGFGYRFRANNCDEASDAGRRG